MDNNMGNDVETEAKKPRVVSIRIAIIIAVVIVVCALAYVYKGLFIAAMVDGSPISRFTIIKELEKASGKAVLDSLITQKLIENEAAKKGISISDEEINAEIKNIEAQVSGQGNTLDKALAAQGMNRDDLKKRIVIQKTVEKLLADKGSVTDGEVEQYIKNNEVTIPEGKEAEYKNQIKEQLRGEKLNQEAGTLVETLKSAAKINYFKNY